MARAIVGGLLALHGIVHAVGFTATWRLVASPENPYTTSVFNGALDVGDAWIRLVGVLWLVGAAVMVAAAVQVWRGSSHAVAAVVIATTFSLAMCLVGLPAARIGVAVDLAILGVVGAMAITTEGRRARRGSAG